jgi:hypothetical protein
MSSKLVKGNGGAIVNPFAKKILSIEATDDGQTKIESPLPPDEVCKILSNLIIDLQFKYMMAAIQQSQKESLLQQVGEQQVRN